MKIRIIILLAACLIIAGVVYASELPSIGWNVLGGGGGQVEADKTIIMGTIGQAISGETQDEKHYIHSGYWCGADDVYDPPDIFIYLPLVMR